MQNQISTLGAIAIVISSQMGSGTFIILEMMKGIGTTSIFVWLGATLSAVFLSYVVAIASQKSQGPIYPYIKEIIGAKASQISAFLYWIAMCVSNPVFLFLISDVIESNLFILNKNTRTILECSILTLLTCINLLRIEILNKIEIFLTIIKIFVLITIPIIGFWFADSAKATIENNFSQFFIFYPLAMWGFVGLENCTNVSNRMDNKKLVKVMTFGTLIVGIVYIINMAFIQLFSIQTNMTYLTILDQLFGEKGKYFYVFIVLTSCLGSLHSWILSSGQMAFEASKRNLFPKFLQAKNRHDIPYKSVISSSLMQLPIILLGKTLI